MANVNVRKVGSLSQANIAFQNISSERLHLEYRIEWEDKDGFVVDQSGAWRQIVLAPTQIDSVMSVGKTPNAEKVVVTLREPDDAFLYKGVE
jgi:uncharacterized protein YcfL